MRLNGDQRSGCLKILETCFRYAPVHIDHVLLDHFVAGLVLRPLALFGSVADLDAFSRCQRVLARSHDGFAACTRERVLAQLVGSSLLSCAVEPAAGAWLLLRMWCAGTGSSSVPVILVMASTARTVVWVFPVAAAATGGSMTSVYPRLLCPGAASCAIAGKGLVLAVLRMAAKEGHAVGDSGISEAGGGHARVSHTCAGSVSNAQSCSCFQELAAIRRRMPNVHA